MALALNKLILANALANTPGAYFQPVTVSNVGAGNTTAMVNSQFIPAGLYVLPATANVVIEFNAYTGTANSWTSIVANNTSSAVLISDGVNVRANATTGTQTVTLYTVNGGQAATQSSYATS
jgi:hypothetical protein